MTRARVTSLVKLVTVLSTVVLFVLVSILCYQFIRMNHLSSANAQLDRKIEELSITQSTLEEGIEVRSTDAYVEQQARENLGMIKVSGETVYTF